MNAGPRKKTASGAPARRWNWLALGLGFICAACIAVLAVAQRPAIEAQLARSAGRALELTGEGWAGAYFVGRDAVITGEALAEEARTKVRGVLANLSGVRRVVDRTTLLPERNPFTFSAVRDGRTLQLSGYVPSGAALERITAAARAMPGITSVKGIDQLVRARGAPPGDFAAVVAFGLDQLSLLPTGRVILSDDALAIEGRSPDLSTYEALSATLHEPLPQGFRLARFAVRPPVVAPFMWSALREGNEVRALGYIPSQEARRSVLAALRAAVPQARITDEMRLGDGAPSSELWLKAVTFAAMQLALLPKGRVVLSDTTMMVEGAAPTFEVFDALQAGRRAPPEGFSVTRFAVEPPAVSPFVWRAERRAEQVRLSGFVISEEARRGLSDAARSLFPGVPVADETRLASGGPLPETFAAAAQFGLTQLARMRLGEAVLDGARLSLDGEALDAEAFAGLVKAAGAPPARVDIKAALRPPFISPFVFAVRRDGQGVTLSGFLPDTAAQEAVAGLLEALFPGEKVQDVAALGSGAPSGFVEAVKAGLVQMVRLDPAELRLTGTELRLSGDALHAAAGQQIDAALAAALPKAFSVETQIVPAQPGAPLSDVECLPLADSLTARSLTFERDTSRLDIRGAAMLDRLAHLAQRCPDATLEVALETASGSGVPAALARARAMEIAAHLTRAGILPGRIVIAPSDEVAPGDGSVAVQLRAAQAPREN